MNRFRIPIVYAVILTLILASNIYAENILYARYPALSPDGQTIAFTYQGDIWTVPTEGGRARRLTVHEAEDIQPHYSPDGSKILFSSRRFDNYDLFVMPADGGEARRLTYFSGTDIGTGWFPGSDSVVFASTRAGWNDLYKVAITGGTPIELTGYRREQEFNGRISSDGRYLIFNNGSLAGRWWRRDLRASRNTDIFLQDRSIPEFTSRRLTDYDGHDGWPVLNEERDEVYFVSCRDDWAQVWKMPLAGGDAQPLTDFSDDGVQWLNANPRGTMLVFEQGFHIWVMDPADGKPRMVEIDITSDERENLVETKTFNGNVEWFSLSPDEKKIAAVIHGEIFVLPADDPEEGRQVTFTAAREMTPVWDKDSKTIFYTSDRNENGDIFSTDVTTGIETRLTQSPENEVKPIVSPDGRYLACYRGLDKIIRIDLESGRETEWVTGLFFDLGVEPTVDYDWSPDSRWLVFTMAGATYETDIHVVDLDGNIHNISKFAGSNYRPRFATDGKSVYFSSNLLGRHDTYRITLTHEPVDFFESAFDSLFMDTLDDDDDDTDKKDDGNIDSVEVVIDFDRIERRREKAFELTAASEYPALTPDGKSFLFISSVLEKPEIWSVGTGDEPELKQLTHSGKPKSLLHITGDSKHAFYLENGKINKMTIEGNEGTVLAFAARLEIDTKKLNRQKYDEAWNMLNTYFYDDSFHGADWAAARDKYSPVIDHIRTEPEFRNLLKELMGELRASHLDVYSGRPGPDNTVTTGMMGIVLDYKVLDRDGIFRIGRVIPESPADLAGLKAGQYVTAINGTALSPATNLFALLSGTVDHRVMIGIGDRADRTDRVVAVKPIDLRDLNPLVDAEWVENRRRMVDSLSAGRLAYIHIPAMSSSRLNKFQEELVAIAEAKEGLIIDVRDNGGGNIAVHLLGILVKTPYFLRNFRDFPVTSENKMRSKALEKPMTLLINNYSASNSEIFAEGFRKLKLGKIIGERTAGAVIGTSSYYLIDGTRIRRPSWGAYTAEMVDTELKPRYPDITVENLPDDFINGRDPQLVRAVNELLKEL